MTAPITDYRAWVEERRSICRLEGAQIVFGRPERYWISLHRCNSHEAILRWVVHLSSKTWVTTETLEQFVNLAIDANNLSPDDTKPG